jgi:hypothetical protein
MRKASGGKEKGRIALSPFNPEHPIVSFFNNRFLEGLTF